MISGELSVGEALSGFGSFVPLADALNSSGGIEFLVDALLSAVGDSGPYIMLIVIFFLTAGLGLVLSNTASAVLVILLPSLLLTNFKFHRIRLQWQY